MGYSEEALANPFSRENAWITFQKNMETAARMRDEVLREKEQGGAGDREMLMKATEALGCLTDNTILKKVVEKALEERDRS